MGATTMIGAGQARICGYQKIRTKALMATMTTSSWLWKMSPRQARRFRLKWAIRCSGEEPWAASGRDIHCEQLAHG